MAAKGCDTAPTAAMPEDDPQRHIFPFFELPRELRDLVYDELLLPMTCSKTGDGLIGKAQNVVFADLMTPNGQFASEYQDRARKKTVLVLSDQGCLDPIKMGMDLSLPTAARAIRHLKFNITDHGTELHEHFAWMSAFVRQPHIESVNIKVVRSTHHANSLRHLLADCTPLTKLQNLRSLEIFWKDKKFGYIDWEAQQLMILRWSVESGSFEKFAPAGVEEDMRAQLMSA